MHHKLLGILVLSWFIITSWTGEGDLSIPQNEQTLVWWGWPLLLLLGTFILGIIAVLGGVGGGVLFVPIVSSFFPFNLDFVRGAGLLVALSASLSAGPGLLKRSLANLRLTIPLALVASSSAIVGAMMGLALPKSLINILLGMTILGIVVIMFIAKKSEYPHVEKPDTLSQFFQLYGIYYEPTIEKNIEWKVHRLPWALVCFIGIGILAGMFGLGAGWANVPVLNLLMGVPLKVAVSTSVFLLSITDTSAAWIYLNSGAMIPMIVIPSVIGVMLGSRVGVKILTVANPKVIRWVVMGILAFAGVRSILKGFQIWN